jgi:hypothetical protein
MLRASACLFGMRIHFARTPFLHSMAMGFWGTPEGPSSLQGILLLEQRWNKSSGGKIAWVGEEDDMLELPEGTEFPKATRDQLT